MIHKCLFNYVSLFIQVSEDDELYNEQRQKICSEAKSMTTLFPTSVVALELLAKGYLQSLTTTRKCKITVELYYI